MKQIFIVLGIVVLAVKCHAQSKPEESRMKIERGIGAFSSDLGEADVQLIATQLPPAVYYIRAAYIAEGTTIDNAPRVFYVYKTLDDLKQRTPIRRTLWLARDGNPKIVSGTESELLSAYLLERSASTRFEEVMPKAIVAILYEGRAKLLSEKIKALSDLELDIFRFCGPTRHADLRNLCCDAALSDDGLREKWEGRFIRDDGGVDDVSVLLGKEGKASVQCVKLIPRGGFPEVKTSGSAAEQWTVLPTKRGA